jgi:hypothetical protein
MPIFKNILIEGTEKTPQVDFNLNSGELILSGRSIPENAVRIFEPLVEWVNEYVKKPQPTTNFRLNLEYFNSASLIWISKIVRSLSKIELPDYVLFIHMYFDIEDFSVMDMEELKEIVLSLVDKIGKVKVSIGIKIYGTDNNGTIIKESMIFI